MNNSKYNKKSHLLKSPLGDLGVTPNMFYGAPPILFEFAKNLRNNSTEAEIFLWNFIYARS